VVQYGVNVHPHEVQVVLQIVKGLRSCGLDVHKGKGLGVISPYRSQVRALKSGLSSLFSSDKIYNVSCAESGSYADRDMTGERSVGVEEKRDERVDNNECEVSTVDSFQGRDMDVVILSTVKNVDEGLVRCMLIDIYCFCHLYVCIDITFAFYCFYEITDVACIHFTYDSVSYTVLFLPYFIPPQFLLLLFHSSLLLFFILQFYHSSRVLEIY
jgi:AAA domain